MPFVLKNNINDPRFVYTDNDKGIFHSDHTSYYRYATYTTLVVIADELRQSNIIRKEMLELKKEILELKKEKLKIIRDNSQRTRQTKKNDSYSTQSSDSD